VTANWLQVPLFWFGFFFSIFFLCIDKVNLGGATLPRHQGAGLFGHCCTVHLTAAVQKFSRKLQTLGYTSVVPNKLIITEIRDLTGFAH